jgi:hypothetical protein
MLDKTKVPLFMTSLVEAVRKTLRTCYPTKLTSAQVRDRLRFEGFDFSSYETNPLPSVSTTLRRLKEAGEITRSESETVASYQAKLPQGMCLQRDALNVTARE